MKNLKKEGGENMKNRKKTIILAAACAGMLAITAFGTLAYFTADNEAKNTFMVADSDTPTAGGALFGVEVKETVTTGENITANGNGGYTYKNIMPGMELEKDVKVKNSGKYSEYVRVTITLDKTDVWGEKTLTDLVGTINTEKWESAGEPTTGTNDKTWVYYYKEALAADTETPSMFTKVTIPKDLTTEQMSSLKEFNITVKAEAIQSENLKTAEGAAVNTAADAFGLFDAQQSK